MVQQSKGDAVHCGVAVGVQPLARREAWCSVAAAVTARFGAVSAGGRCSAVQCRGVRGAVRQCGA